MKVFVVLSDSSREPTREIGESYDYGIAAIAYKYKSEAEKRATIFDDIFELEVVNEKTR
jgi:hypothetical protein